MRISDWSSDVCSSDLLERLHADAPVGVEEALSLLPQRLVDVGRFLDGIDNAVFIEAGPNDLGQACVFRSLSAEEELIIFGSFAVHAPNADVSGMMLTAGVDCIGRASSREKVCQNVYI